MDNFSRNLKVARSALGLSQKEAAKAIGVRQSAYSNYENGVSKPSFDILVKLSKFLGVSTDDLLMSSSLESKDIVKNKPEQSREHLDEFMPTIVHIDKDGSENIVMVNSRVAAGYPMNLENPEYFSDLPTFSLPTFRFRNGTFRCFEVEGESMKTTLDHGDWVIARFIDDWVNGIQDGYVHVVITIDSLLVKRCLNRINERSAIVLQSDNEDFSTYQILKEDIKEVWRVTAKIGFNLSNNNNDVRTRLINLEDEVYKLDQRIKSMES